MKKRICLLAVSSFMLLAACGNNSTDYLKMPKGGQVEDLGETAGIETVAKSIADMSKNTLEALKNPSEEKIIFNDVSFNLTDSHVYKDYTYGNEVNGAYANTYGSTTEVSLDGSIESGNNGVFGKALKDVQAYAKVNDLSVSYSNAYNDVYEYSAGYDGDKYEDYHSSEELNIEKANFAAYYDKGAVYFDLSNAKETINSIFDFMFGEDATLYKTISDAIYEETNGKIVLSQNIGETEIGEMILNIDELIGTPIEDVFAPFYNIDEESMATIQAIMDIVSPIITFKTYKDDSFAIQITFNNETIIELVSNIILSISVDEETSISEEEIAMMIQEISAEIKEVIGKFDFNFVLKTDAKKRLDSIGIMVDADINIESDEDGEDFKLEEATEDSYYSSDYENLKVSGEIDIDFSYGKMSSMPKFKDYVTSQTFETYVGMLLASEE